MTSTNGNTPSDKARNSLQANQTANAVTALTTTRKELLQLLTDMQPQIKAALPKHITPERIIRVALTAVSRTPKLLECSKESLLGAIIQSSQLGLEPDGALGQAYLVPFFNGKTKRLECQFIPGYRGYIDLARRSGNIVSITAQVVRAGDQFEYEFGLNEKLRHMPALENRGDITHVYAYAKLSGNGYAFEVMTKRDVDAIMARSKSRDREGNITGPWQTDYEPMARKTVLRRLSKWLPLSVEMAKAIALDERATSGVCQGLDIKAIDPATGEIPLAEMEEAEPVETPTTTPAAVPGAATVPDQGMSRTAEIMGHVRNVKTKQHLKIVETEIRTAGESGDITEKQASELLDELTKREEAIQNMPK